MKRVMLFCLMLLMFQMVSSQVAWNYFAKKIGDKTYEVHLTANINEPWHIYSQKTPEGGPIPTEVFFTKNPLVSLSGKPKEIGDLREKFEDVFGVEVRYYDKKVDFVQILVLKRKVKTNLSGAVEFMVCNDHECRPPEKVQFNVRLE